MGLLSTLFPLAMFGLGIPELGLANGAGNLLSQLFGGAGGAAASLPAATAIPGVVGASPDFLSAVGLPASMRTAGAASLPNGFDFSAFLKNGGNVMGLLNQAKQLTTPPPQPTLQQPQTPAAPTPPAAAPAPAPVTTGAGSVGAAAADPYTTALQSLMRKHGSSAYGY